MIRPAYWTDADLQTRLTADVREFYIGLWMLADDAGYVAWDVDRVGAELYPYRPMRWRRAHLDKWITALNSHVRMLECGQHLVVPSLPKHQAPPKPSFPNQRAHERCIRQVAPHGATGGQVGPPGTSTGREGKGKEGNWFEGGARRANGLATDEEAREPTEFERLVAKPA